MTSPHGHDAFLKEWELLTEVIQPFIEQAFLGVERP
jgi:homoserine acetyltransferase